MSRFTPSKIHNSKRTPGPSLKVILISLSVLVCVGIFLCAVLIPSDVTARAVLSTARSEAHSLSDKLIEWMPSHQVDHVYTADELPNWNVDFWTPIDIDISADPMVVLCKLNFKKYWEQPHSYPMFRDLENLSGCVGSNRRREKMSVLLREVEENKDLPEGRVVDPTGFVFHESRVGSTLIANFLASDPWSLVFSESTPIANAILHCSSCSRSQQVQLFRNIMTLMGRSPIHKRLFAKFQSITTTKIEIVLEAFPNTPWAFVFRQPVQTMMSHLDPQKGSTAAPCLRSKRNPPDEVRESIRTALSGEKAPNEAWCAAHLNMLCSNALRAYSRFNSTGEGKQRAVMVNYDSLPGAVPNVLLPLFGVKIDKLWVDKMKQESKHYSKSRGSKFRLFFGDSKDKDERATSLIQKFADDILAPSYEALNKLSISSIAKVVPLSLPLQPNSEVADWSAIKEFPSDESFAERENGSLLNGEGQINHSDALIERNFQPWLPFSNHHNSKTFFHPHCPEIPEPGYPKAFSMLDLLNNWNSDVTDIPAFHYDSLCHFDYRNQTEVTFATNYRDKEVPFVMYNIPELDQVVKKWSNLDYLSKLLGGKDYRTETSKDNHFMYWRGGSRAFLRSTAGSNWKPPTDVIKENFEEWLEVAVKGQNKSLDDRVHHYFRVSSDAGNHWLFDELPFFKPKKSLFMVDPNEQRGIHCRFGMRSVIAEAHFDGSRNSVVMLGGMRRWILAHPDQCINMHMLGPMHPSGRHSEVDWSNPDVKKFPNFAKVMGNEVILRPGDFLFVPTYWIHYIVSLNVNYQCNTRSGAFRGYDKYIKQCGF